jgi:hypothetical protein
MADLTSLVEVLVSIQDTTPEHRHLAAGVLGDSNLVLVPAPSRDLLDRNREFDVVTIPQPLSAGFPVERLRAKCANIMWVAGRPIGAMLTLRQPSGYAGGMGRFQGGALAEHLERADGDLWAALESLGTVRAGLREGPPADVLAVLSDIEHKQRQVTYRDHELAGLSEVGWSICRWLCICQPT